MGGKCCRDCVFMVRNEWRSGFLSAPGYQIQESASSALREAIFDGSLTLLGQKLRDWDQYIEKYEAAERANDPGNAFLRGLNTGPFANYNNWEKYGLPEPPSPPPADEWLSCWQKQWSEGRERIDAVSPTFLNSHSCGFYFPFGRKGKRDLNGCDKQRVHELDKGRFVLTLVIMVLTAVLASSLFSEFFQR